jgi:hypothetical protein
VDVTTPRINRCLQCETRKAGNICSLSARVCAVARRTIDAALGNDAEWITQSIVVTREFFRLVFALIAPQNDHCRLSRRIAYKVKSFANNIVTALSLCGAKYRVGTRHGRLVWRIQ